MRITASDTLEILGVPPVDGAAIVVSLMKGPDNQFKISRKRANAVEEYRQKHHCFDTLSPPEAVSISNVQLYLAYY
jgi:hypothetical protein